MGSFKKSQKKVTFWFSALIVPQVTTLRSEVSPYMYFIYFIRFLSKETYTRGRIHPMKKAVLFGFELVTLLDARRQPVIAEFNLKLTGV